MFVDAHAHLHARPDWTAMESFLSGGRITQVWLLDLPPDEMRYLPLASAAEVLEAARRWPDVCVPFGFLDFRKPPSVVDELRDQGFVGLKPYRPLKPYNHPDHFPHFARAEALGMPILFHTGIVAYGRPDQTGPAMAPGPDHMRPVMLQAIAESFPRLQLIGGHLGYPWLDETELNLYYYPNISHDLSGYRKDVEWLIRVLDRKCNDRTGRYFNDKILFGSDGFYGDPESHLQIGRRMIFWDLFLEMVGGCYYRWGDAQERAKILGGNAAALLAAARRGA